MIDYQALLSFAMEARKKSYSPYSEFRVGAALLTEDDKVYLGCNIENASYSVTCCAERTALFSAVAAGERKFKALALVGGKQDEPDDEIFPCGVCRQALCEFCPPDMPIVVKYKDTYRVFLLKDILPMAFLPDAL
ncbi:MAG: cytidine deaminase [Clostridia bacterium]|nr:cytidine deaminase [Clostridia bacterium]